MASRIHNASTSPDREGVHMNPGLSVTAALHCRSGQSNITFPSIGYPPLAYGSPTMPSQPVSLNTLTVLSPARPLTTTKLRSSTGFLPPQAPQSTMAGTRLRLTNCSNPSWTSALMSHLVSVTPALPYSAASRVSTTRTAADPACFGEDTLLPSGFNLGQSLLA